MYNIEPKNVTSVRREENYYIELEKIGVKIPDDHQTLYLLLRCGSDPEEEEDYILLNLIDYYNLPASLIFFKQMIIDCDHLSSSG